MPEKVRIRARPAEPEDETGARPRRRAVVEALQVAASMMPSRDPAKNGLEKVVIHTVIGMPPAVVLIFAVHAIAPHGLVVPHVARDLWLYRAGLFAALMFGTEVFTPLIAFIFSLLLSRSGGRVQQALVCPYCRDSVGQEGTVACVRAGCGSLYHRECWDECAVQYGGCAIYGCGSKKSREVSAAGYLLRLSRLVIAAAVFPPRIARAIRKHSGTELRSTFRSSLETARGWQSHVAGTPANRAALWLVLGVPTGFVAAAMAVQDRVVSLPEWEVGACLILSFFGFPAIFVTFPFVAAFLISLPYFFARGIGLAMRNELAALLRADEGGGSVIGRLAAGFGKKNVS